MRADKFHPHLATCPTFIHGQGITAGSVQPELTSTWPNHMTKPKQPKTANKHNEKFYAEREHIRKTASAQVATATLRPENVRPAWYPVCEDHITHREEGCEACNAELADVQQRHLARVERATS